MFIEKLTEKDKNELANLVINTYYDNDARRKNIESVKKFALKLVSIKTDYKNRGIVIAWPTSFACSLKMCPEIHIADFDVWRLDGMIYEDDHNKIENAIYNYFNNKFDNYSKCYYNYHKSRIENEHRESMLNYNYTDEAKTFCEKNYQKQMKELNKKVSSFNKKEDEELTK